MANETDSHASRKAVKKEYYEKDTVVSRYDSSRFGTRSGYWIKQSEENTVSWLIQKTAEEKSGVALDLPTGTGRMIPVLRKKYNRIIACDISRTMLNQAVQYGADQYMLADASKLMLKSGSVDFILASRFFFHFEYLDVFFAEMARVLVNGGYMVFDAYNWTPRSLIPGKQKSLGGRVYTHSRNLIELYAGKYGFSIVDSKGLFVITPFIYQYLPFPAVKIIEFIGNTLFPGCKTKTYYLFVKK